MMRLRSLNMLHPFVPRRLKPATDFLGRHSTLEGVLESIPWFMVAARHRFGYRALSDRWPKASRRGRRRGDDRIAAGACSYFRARALVLSRHSYFPRLPVASVIERGTRRGPKRPKRDADLSPMRRWWCERQPDVRLVHREVE